MTTTPKPEPASDEEIAAFTGDIAIYRREHDGKLHCMRCYAESAGHRPGCDHAMWPSIKARIESDRADVGRLRARVAELEAALSELETRIFALGSDGPICQLHRLKLSALVDFIRAALKPEPR